MMMIMVVMITIQFTQQYSISMSTHPLEPQDKNLRDFIHSFWIFL